MERRVPPQRPPCLLAKEDIEPTVRKHIEQHAKLLQNLIQVAQVSEVTFSNTVQPLADLKNLQSGEKAVIDGLKYFSPDKECQLQAEKAGEEWDKYYSKQGLRIYQLIKHLYKDRTELNIDAESQRLLDRMMQDHKNDGLGVLDANKLQERQERSAKINELCTEINRNIRHWDSGEWLSPEELEGVPLKDRQSIPKDRTDSKALYKHSSRYMTIMRYAHSSKTRRRMLEGSHSCLQENALLFRQVILLRDEHARELGFSNHAASKIPDRIMESTESVEDMLRQLEEALLPLGRESFDRVHNKKREFLREGNGSLITDAIPSDLDKDCLMQWEYLYYDKMTEDDGNTNPIAEYFPLHHTFHGMLELFSDCLQIKFDSIPYQDIQDHLWHPSIMSWAVWDQQDGQFIGYLFADLESRSNKYKGAQSVNLQPGYEKPDGTRVFPANTIMCNYQNNSPTTGCILPHTSVVTMFHELGHSIHDLLARTKYADCHGYNVTLELGEGIAMMLEQWCWLPDEIKALSCHYTSLNQEYADAWLRENPGKGLPPRQIPIERLEQRFAKRKVYKANKILGQLTNVYFDLAVHNPRSREDLLQLDESRVFGDIFERLRFRKVPEKTLKYVHHGLLVSGYDAGYYAYICAEVLAADLFQSNFARDPRSREAWSRFRREILEKGGSQDELSLIKQFVGGRSIDPRAFLSLYRVGKEAL